MQRGSSPTPPALYNSPSPSLSLSLSCTSDDDVGGLLGRVAHVVAGHTAVDAGLVGGDGGQGEGAPVQDALLGEALCVAHPGEGGGGLPAGGDAHQGDRVPRVGDDGVLDKQLNVGGGWEDKGRENDEMVPYLV